MKITLMIGLIAVLTLSSCLSRRSSTTVTAPMSISTTMTAAAGEIELKNSSTRTLQYRIGTITGVLAPTASVLLSMFSGKGTTDVPCEIYESGKILYSSRIKVGSLITVR